MSVRLEAARWHRPRTVDIRVEWSCLLVVHEAELVSGTEEASWIARMELFELAGHNGSMDAAG